MTHDYACVGGHVEQRQHYGNMWEMRANILWQDLRFYAFYLEIGHSLLL